MGQFSNVLLAIDKAHTVPQTQTQTQTQKFFYSTLKIHNDFKNRHMQNIKTFWIRETSVKTNKIIAGTDATL